jgi:hypothetical protein
MKFKFGLEQKQTGMRNMIVAHIFKAQYDLKEKKRPVWGSVGGLYKRFRPPPARPQRFLRLNYTINGVFALLWGCFCI